MEKPVHTIDEYKEISADVWNVFKKYFSEDADWDAYMDELNALDAKYHRNVRQYEFFCKLNRVYGHELGELFSYVRKG